MNPSPVSSAALLSLIDYSQWANGKLLDAATRVPEEALLRDFGISHGSLLGTLQHIYYADRIWHGRFLGQPPAVADPAPGPSLSELKERWPALLGELRAWVAARSEEELGAEFSGTRLNGMPFTSPRWQALLHVVNHATLHRGQVMSLLRQLGHVPPNTDLFAYYQQASLERHA